MPQRKVFKSSTRFEVVEKRFTPKAACHIGIQGDNDELRLKLSGIEKCINPCDNRTNSLDEYLEQVYVIVKETARRISQGDIIVTATLNDRL